MFELKATLRDTKQDTKKLQEEGMIPAVYYGRKQKSTNITLPRKEFIKLWRDAGETSVVTINTPDGKVDTLIHEVQSNPVTDVPIHVDFYVVEKDRKVKVSIPLEFVGTSSAIKEKGGVLTKVMHEIELNALPANLPNAIEVNLALLVDFSSQITVKDIKLPEGAEAVPALEDVIASVSEAKEEEAEVVEVDMDSIEVEQKGKKEEEETEEAPKE